MTDEPETRVGDPSEVQVCAAPWVSGTRAVRYLDAKPSLSAPLLDFKDFEKVVSGLITEARTQVWLAGGNWIVGFELTVDKDANPTTVRLDGTGAVLESLF